MTSIVTRAIYLGMIVTALIAVGCASPSHTSAVTSAMTDTVRVSDRVIGQEITVFRSPTCSCCGKWIEHMQTAGFVVDDEVIPNVNAVKQRYGIPGDLASCHTAVIGNYVIEGHVPAEDVRRLLMEMPPTRGLAAPGMPMGSPGMESGDYIEPYTVIAFTLDGTTTNFAHHP